MVTKLDATQLQQLLNAMAGHETFLSPSNIIALIAVIISIAALSASLSIFSTQKWTEQRSYAARLHEIWWSEELDEKRHIVWKELERWQKLGNESPAIKYYGHSEHGWTLESPEREAHARVLFFFADLNALLRHKLIDRNVAFEMFGVAQYDWFRDYFRAIRATIKERESDKSRWPRFVTETEEFEIRLDRWKAARGKSTAA